MLGIDIDGLSANFVLFDGQRLQSRRMRVPIDAPFSFFDAAIDLFSLSSSQASALTVIHNNDNASAFCDFNEAIYIKKQPFLFLDDMHFTQPMIACHIGRLTTDIFIIDEQKISHSHTLSIGSETPVFLENNHFSFHALQSVFSAKGAACFGEASLPTVLDAHLVLGRLRPEIPASQASHIDINAARMALSSLSCVSYPSITDTAHAIITLFNQTIIATLKKLPIPAEASLCPSGDTGLHMCAIAEALMIKNISVPVCHGTLAAWHLLKHINPDLQIAPLPSHGSAAACTRLQLHGITLPVSQWQRHTLGAEEIITGPAIINDDTTALFMQNGWLCYVNAAGDLRLRRMAIEVYQ